MLLNTLNTNEVKNAAGAEVEFQRLSTEGRTTEFGVVNETPNLPHRLKISHQESGAGTQTKRRSMFRIDKTVAGVDGSPVVCRGCFWLEIPVGNLGASTEPKNVCAEMMSFAASTGADTTIKYDCTGNGADVLINGGL